MTLLRPKGRRKRVHLPQKSEKETVRVDCLLSHYAPLSPGLTLSSLQSVNRERAAAAQKPDILPFFPWIDALIIGL